MKSPIAFAIVAFSIGIIWHAHADPTSEVTPPGAASSGARSTKAAPAGTPEEKDADVGDDTLYRGKTSETENPMLRDEGALHFKTRPKEKVQEVDSLKSLHSSSTDPKFQGSLLNSDINAIEKISEKANENREETDQGDPRFKTKRLTVTLDKNDESKKVQSDSSPSPTPSPTTSPAAKNSGETK